MRRIKFGHLRSTQPSLTSGSNVILFLVPQNSHVQICCCSSFFVLAVSSCKELSELKIAWQLEHETASPVVGRASFARWPNFINNTLVVASALWLLSSNSGSMRMLGEPKQRIGCSCLLVALGASMVGCVIDREQWVGEWQRSLFLSLLWLREVGFYFVVPRKAQAR